MKNDGGHVSNSVVSVAACPLVPLTTAPPVTTAAPGTGSTDVTTDSSTNFMCQDILQMVEIKDQWNCRSCSRARIYGSMQGITSDHIMTMTFNKEIDFNQLCFSPRIPHRVSKVMLVTILRCLHFFVSNIRYQHR